MTIDEAIKHAEEVAESQEYEGKKLEESGKKYHDEYENYCASQCFECAEEHRQLAEWLKELKQLKEQTGWIPVSERLPKPFSYVDCTCHSLIDDREDWVVETCYVPQPQNSPYSDWGNIPMLNDGDCEVVAWMYREIPKPYKAIDSEKEDKE